MITDAQIMAAMKVLAGAENPCGATAVRAALKAAENAAWRPISEAPKDAGDGDTYTVEAPTIEGFRKAIRTATGLTEAQLEGLANGTMVCVPVEPTEARVMDCDQGLREIVTAIYRAMLAAKEG